ncbi:GLUG motif-containing protein [Chromohalobacter israelensis]|uniref:GLUG motif-containing protein n=1 Tax=Chromohalobacter israelensis TaxID=141390 RepID=UPI000FFECD84|nr:GLUG motif-containing protein [Chromohalobacter salexigens]RXE46773.1 hypothetical protein B4O83_01650 [Chromohalobacter salexigens]
MGGLVGRNYGSGSIIQSYATGAVSGTARVGGLVGSISNSSIENSYASGRVSGARQVSGLVGYNYNVTATESYYVTTDADGNRVDGVYTNSVGKPRTRLELMNPATFEGWDEAIWNFGGGDEVKGYQVALPWLDGVTPTAGRVTDTLFQSGTGTSSDPYILTGWQQLQNVNFNDDVLGGGHHFALVNNLDSGTAGYADLAGENANGGKGWDPVGDDGTPFTGTFDGLGHAVSQVTIDRPNDYAIGLFGRIENATLRGLGLEGGSVRGGAPTTGGGIGGLVGYNDSGTITDVYATGSVTGEFEKVGGLVGYNDGGTIIQSYAAGDVSSDVIFAGGLVGYNVDGTISQSYATGDVSVDDYGAGGLVGTNLNGTITHSYATGDVLAPTNAGELGGLVGWNSQGTISHTYATGNVSEGYSRLGGLVGNNNGTVTDSFYATTDADGSAIDGDYTNSVGNGQPYAKLTQLDTFSAWGDDIDARGSTDATWRLYEGHATPLLRSFLTPVSVSPDGSGLSGHTYDGNTATGSTGYATNVSGTALKGRLNYRTDEADAGHYRTRDESLVLSGLYSGQQGYDISYDAASLTIDKADATVTANSATTTYDGTEQSVAGFTASGLANGEDEAVLADVSTSGGRGTDAGTYDHTVSGTDENYNLTFDEGTLTIERRSVVVTADDQRKTAGNADPTFTWQTGCGALTSGCGLVAGERLDGALTRDPGEAPGNYAIRQGSVNDATNPNYAINFVPGRLGITEANAAPQPGDTLFPLPARSTISALQQRGAGDESDHTDADEGLMLHSAGNEVLTSLNAADVELPGLRVENGGIALPAVQDEPTSGAQ